MSKKCKHNTVAMVGALPPIKGNAYYSMRLAQHMSKRLKVIFVAFKKMYPDFLYPGGVEDNDPNFQVIESETLRIERIITYYNPLSWLKAAFLARTKVVHMQWWSLPLAPIYIVMLLLFRAARRKVVFTVHNVMPHERRILDKFVNKMVLSFGSAFIVHSAKNKLDLIKNFKMPEKHVHIVHMPVHDMYRTGGKSSWEVRAALGIDSDRKIILSFGNIRPYKGIDLLINGMPRILEMVPNAHLVIAGQDWGDWNETYGIMIKDAGISGNVTTRLDYIPMSEVGHLFEIADLVVLPYHHFDAQSGVGNIALSFDKPIVVSKVGGLPDLVKDERAIFEPGDVDQMAERIAKILTDQTIYAKLVHDSVALRNDFSWERAIDKTLRIYEEHF